MQSKITKLVFIVLSHLFVFVSFSQSNCGSSSLDSAEDRYAIGKLTECISGLQYCLQHKGFNTDEQIHAYKLIAMSYLAIDMRNSADSAIQNIFFIQPDFNADISDPDRFKNELLYLRTNQSESIVSSVSKRPEDVRLAPATTAVITHEEILQRGYTDLIDILKDIPGFDVSVYYGQLYANVYQRGLRTNNTDKTLLLFDGLEDNDLWSNFADISQQYPVTNIKQVEIIYGPASTMYGPNAFSGVINVITKDAKDYLHNNRPFGLQFNAGTGSYNTKYFDLSTAYKKGIFSFTATGRLYYSDRPDLSSQTLFDYDPYYFDTSRRQSDNVYFKKQKISSNGVTYLKNNGIEYIQNGPTQTFTDPNGLFTLLNYDSSHFNPSPTVAQKRASYIELTNSGIDKARRLDQQGYVSNAYSHFNNSSKSYYINAKLNISNFSLGLVSWSKDEGAGTTYTDRIYSVNGTRWKPEHSYIYSAFNQQFSNRLSLSISANYRVHRIDNGSRITRLKSYYSGDLDLADLENNVPSSLYSTYYFEQSQQFRSEMRVAYSQSKYFNVVGGIEIRNGLFQKYYLTDTLPEPAVTGKSGDGSGNNFYNIKDIGAYVQAAFRTESNIGITLGARMDNNTITQTKGLGTTISPRIVADYSINNWVFKTIYSAGIQNISNFTRFGDVVLTPDNSGKSSLQPERISNYEASASGMISKRFSIDADLFYSKVKNVVSAVIQGPVTANQNIGKFRIWGLQANANYKTKNFQLSINYTFTNPKQIQGIFRTSVIDTIDTLMRNNVPVKDTSYKDSTYLITTNKSVGDIASSKINAIINYSFLKHYNINFRMNYISQKKVGSATTVPNNLLPTFPSYFLSNASFTISDPFKLTGFYIQLNCNNIFNKTYFSPGIRGAGGLNYPDQILQMGRNFSLKLNYEL